jgi:ribose 5-phosphate isomerase B
MIVYLSADHRGFALKEQVRAFVAGAGHDVRDLTPHTEPDDDYPVVAHTLVEKVLREPGSRGMLFCGSGAGVAIAANRFLGIRAALGMNPQEIAAARHDDDVNVLAFAADFTTLETAQPIVDAFLNTAFGGDERYVRRIKEFDPSYG